ncbi:MFS transporter [Bradyrhizobium sp. USDA 4459]
MQKIVVFIAALSIIMDGFDGQLIGFAVPVLIKEWGVTRGDFAPALAAGLVGMGIGSAFAGLLADRFGRRGAVIVSVMVFGLATFCIGFAANLWQIGALRFVAGLGIGGALPSSTTVAAEFTPARRRTLAITATIVCVPLGGMLAGLFAGVVLPNLGWRALFFLGGTLAVLLGFVLLFILPETPRFLARRPARWARAAPARWAHVATGYSRHRVHRSKRAKNRKTRGFSRIVRKGSGSRHDRALVRLLSQPACRL